MVKPYIEDRVNPWLLDSPAKVAAANVFAKLEHSAYVYRLGDHSPYKPLFWIE